MISGNTLKKRGWVEKDGKWHFDDAISVSFFCARAIETSPNINTALWYAGEILYPAYKGRWQQAMADDYGRTRQTISGWLWGRILPDPYICQAILNDANKKQKEEV